MKRVRNRFEISKSNSDKQATGPTMKSNPMLAALQMYGLSLQSLFTSLILVIPEESLVSTALQNKCQRITSPTTKSNSIEYEKQADKYHLAESMAI